MKKTYVKPEVHFESFELSTSIATGCSAGYNHSNTNFGNPNTCTLKFGTETVFLSKEAGCTLPDYNEEKFCYHVPTADDKIFSS